MKKICCKEKKKKREKVAWFPKREMSPRGTWPILSDFKLAKPVT